MRNANTKSSQEVSGLRSVVVVSKGNYLSPKQLQEYLWLKDQAGTRFKILVRRQYRDLRLELKALRSLSRECAKHHQHCRLGTQLPISSPKTGSKSLDYLKHGYQVPHPGTELDIISVIGHSKDNSVINQALDGVCQEAKGQQELSGEPSCPQDRRSGEGGYGGIGSREIVGSRDHVGTHSALPVSADNRVPTRHAGEGWGSGGGMRGVGGGPTPQNVPTASAKQAQSKGGESHATLQSLRVRKCGNQSPVSGPNDVRPPSLKSGGGGLPPGRLPDIDALLTIDAAAEMYLGMTPATLRATLLRHPDLAPPRYRKVTVGKTKRGGHRQRWVRVLLASEVEAIHRRVLDACRQTYHTPRGT